MSSIDENSIRDFIALTFVTGVGSRTAALLIDRFGSPAACFAQSVSALESFGLKRDTIAAMKSAGPREQASKQLEELDRVGADVLTLTDPRYPDLLRETYDPPIVLYAKGDFDRAMSQPSIAVIGSRHCSTYGRNVAEMLARELAQRGITIISGLARGIDSAAHRSAIEGGGLTLAVMGTGLDTVYPKENRKLADQIIEHGALITEFPLSTPPLPQNFPFRNRVISGLSLGVLIIEGAERSGSLITARMAYEQGREVFAVPGNITSSKSFGPNYLIKDGAKLVQTWRDVVEEFPVELKSRILASERTEGLPQQLSLDEVLLSEAERRILVSIKDDEPVHIDQLISGMSLSSGELLSALLKLEMMDRIKQLPGKCFVRKL
ncbi:MAG: DNA-processing protein DprA [Blastocatellia bacterium]